MKGTKEGISKKGKKKKEKRKRKKEKGKKKKEKRKRKKEKGKKKKEKRKRKKEKKRNHCFFFLHLTYMKSSYILLSRSSSSITFVRYSLLYLISIVFSGINIYFS